MILRRYIIQQTVWTTLLVLVFLVVMLLGGRLIRYFGLAAEGGLQLQLLFRLIGYNLPYFLELILPVSFFIALMLTFGRLYADSEMAALHAAGVSSGRLAWLLLPLLLVLFLLQGYLSLIAKPWGVRQAQAIWQEQSLAQVFDLIRPQEFMSSGNYHLYVGDIDKTQESVADVVVIEKKPNGDSALILASRAGEVEGGDTVQLDLFDGKRYEFNPKSLGYHVIGFDNYRIGLETKVSDMVSPKTAGKPTTSLWMADDADSRAELAYRLSLPCLMVFALLLALPLSKVKPRQGRWLKLLPAILMFVVIAISVIGLKEPIAKAKLPLWAYPLLLLVILSGLLALGAYDGWQRRWVAHRRSPRRAL